jgi:hypothetical protein
MVARAMWVVKSGQPFFGSKVGSELIVELVPVLVLASELNGFIEIVMVVFRYSLSQGFDEQ